MGPNLGDKVVDVPNVVRHETSSDGDWFHLATDDLFLRSGSSVAPVWGANGF